MSSLTLAGPCDLAAPRPARRRSLDVVRGLAVLGMLLVNNAGIEAAAPGQLRHSRGGGLTAADVVFPLFLFVAGVGMSLSPRPPPCRRVLRRCALLAGIGCLLVSAKYRHLSVSTGVLQHIALATLVAYGVLRLPRRWQGPLACAGLLAAWAAPTFVSLPGTTAGSWQPGSTLSAAVERLLTGHLGKEQVVASLVSALTVLAGVFAGRTLLGRPGAPGVRRLLLAALVVLPAGLLLSRSVPIDKTLWTPSYVLVTGALCAVLLAVAVALDLRTGRVSAALTQPLRVLGANAITVYIVSTLLYSAALAPVRGQLVRPLQLIAGDQVASLGYALSSVLLGWALSAVLWRRQILLSL